MQIDLLTLFPEFFVSPLRQSMLRRAQVLGRVSFRVLNLRDFTTDRHQVTDDRPFGGGPGMVMKIEPLVAAIRRVRQEDPATRVILLSPGGRRFDQERARELAQAPHLLLVCGHYEGVDERLRETVITDEISVGDYVLTGGELPALVVIDAVVRLLPGAVGNELSPASDSFADGLLEHPHYTRPREFRGLRVPQALAQGDHEGVRRWRRQMSLLRTYRRRPDLLARAELTEEDRELLAAALEAARDDHGL